MKSAIVDEQNLVMEKVTGETSRSIMNLVRRTSGVESVKIG